MTFKHAGHATAHDDHVGLFRGADLVVGDGLGGNFEGPFLVGAVHAGAGGAGQVAVGGGCGLLGFLGRGGAGGQGTGDDQAGRAQGGALHESTAIDVCSHSASFPPGCTVARSRRGSRWRGGHCGAIVRLLFAS